MSFSIPQQIEKDIIAGRAQYKTFQTGNGGQSILQVPNNSYAVIYGYDFSPAGGGFRTSQEIFISSLALHNASIRFFETQQISFYTGSDFYPFIHHVNTEHAIIPRVFTNNPPPENNANNTTQEFITIDNTPISRQVYITSNKDVTITHGLILNATPAVQNAIPITNRTPQALTYGGSGQVINTQTNYGPGVTPQQFMQPSPKDFQDFGFGLLPGNADGQAFATPDAANGLLDSSTFLTTLGDAFVTAAATNYYLCLHYALYTEAVPEQRG